MKNNIIIVLSIIILILTAYIGKSWFTLHQSMSAEFESQKHYQEMSDKQAKDRAARMEEAFKNLDKTR